MNIFIEMALQYPKLEYPQDYDFLEHVRYDYFHTEIDQYAEIKSTPLMFKQDPPLGYSPKKFGKRLFPENAPFFRGCIRISLDSSK